MHHPPRGDRGAGTRRCRPDRGAVRRRRRARRPRPARNASITSARTLRQTAGSRTTPPLPTSAGPASNCGFTSTTNSAPGSATATSAGQRRSQRDERQVRDDQVGHERQVRGFQVPDVRPLHHRDARVVADLPRELAVPHVDRHHPSGARLQQAVGEPARGRPGVEAIAVTGIDGEPIEGRPELLSPAGDVSTRRADHLHRGVVGDQRGGLRGRAPGDGHPPRSDRGLRFRATARQSPAHELDVEPPTGHGVDP